jgi:cytoplasmic tRNA 2-thiolation protein 2
VQIDVREHRHSSCCVLQVRSCIRVVRTVLKHHSIHRDCFVSSTITKFKRTLGPSVNPPVDGKRKRSHVASGNLLLAFSGGLGSTVLLDLVSRCYFRSTDAGDDQPHGGRNHPRNGGVWSKVTVCYVEVCNAFPGVSPSLYSVWWLIYIM